VFKVGIIRQNGRPEKIVETSMFFTFTSYPWNTMGIFAHPLAFIWKSHNMDKGWVLAKNFTHWVRIGDI